jgi:hypothetical protein
VDNSSNAFTITANGNAAAIATTTLYPAITRNGNTTQGTFTPFSQPDGRWSNYFDGSGDYLTLASNSALTPGSGDFTVEAWLYPTAALSTYNSVYEISANGSLLFGKVTNGYGVRLTGTSDLISATAPAINQWVHVAVTRSGTSLRLFINGELLSTVTNSSNFATGSASIGAGSTGANPFPGYISNLRFIKGTALYTSNFTPSTTPLTAITNTSLLTCQDNRFRDGSSNNFAITRNGDVRVTAFSPFAPTAAYSTSVNGGSGYFDGTGDSIELANSSALQLTNSTAFTLEFWVYPSSVSGTRLLIANYNSTSPFSGYGVAIGAVVSGEWEFWDGNNWRNFGAAVANTWTHIAVSYEGSGTTGRFFINGVQSGSAFTIGSNINRTTGTAYIGAFGAGNYVDGYISNLRVVKGSAVYTSAFTPPTSPLTAITNTSLLCNFTNAGIIDSTGKNVLETVADAQIDTTVKKYGTGSMEFDGTGDWLTGILTNELKIGSGDYTFECWLYRNNSNDCGIYADRLPVPGVSDWNGLLFGITSNKVSILASNNGTSWGLNTVSSVQGNNVPTGQWTHIAISREGSSWRVFIDGVLSYTSTLSGSVVQSAARFFVGDDPGVPELNGYIDDMRITKGIARYTTTFTPPTAPFEDL